MIRVKIEGQKFFRWTVIKYTKNYQNHSFYLCVCECGTEKEVSGNYLRSGKSKSCGCYNPKTKMLHRRRLGQTHYRMLQRCSDPKALGFHNYGGRGIRVCDEWKNFENFYSWALANNYSPGLTLDRINNDGNYEPSNCRWATRKENSQNTRVNTYVFVKGEKICVTEAERRLGVDRHTLSAWKKKNYDIDHCLFLNSQGIKVTKSLAVSKNKTFI